VFVNITLPIDERVVDCAQDKQRATGNTVNQGIGEHRKHIAGDDTEPKSDLELLKRTPGKGYSRGWKYDREEVYEDRLRWPRS
jgi:hypothetical protein